MLSREVFQGRSLWFYEEEDVFIKLFCSCNEIVSEQVQRTLDFMFHVHFNQVIALSIVY